MLHRSRLVPEGMSGQQAASFHMPIEKPPHYTKQQQMDAWHPDMTLSHMSAARQICPSATTSLSSCLPYSCAAGPQITGTTTIAGPNDSCTFDRLVIHSVPGPTCAIICDTLACWSGGSPCAA